MIRPYPILRSDDGSIRLPLRLGITQCVRPLQIIKGAFSRQQIARALRILFPSLVALTITTAAHAQGTMDFSGAQTLMGTFKTSRCMRVP